MMLRLEEVLVLAAVGLAYGVLRWIRRRSNDPKAVASKKAPQPRILKPRTPDDCGQCRGQASHDVAASATSLGSVGPPPYRDVKSRRGRRKQLSTAGYACPNPACMYVGITDESVHALVGYGGHGQAERIQDLKCQACGRKFSTRHGTALYRLRTPSQRVGEVLAALAEGLSVGAAVRVFGRREFTIRSWQARAGMHCAQLHEHFMQGLKFTHVQLDELCLNMKGRAEAMWLWTVVEARTKLMPVVQLGPRTQTVAHAVVHELKARLAPRLAGDKPMVFTSDGLALYFYALTAHFGDWCSDGVTGKRIWQVSAHLIYGQLKKRYRKRRLVDVERQVLIGTQADLIETLRAQGWSGLIQTAFVERANLTLRQSIHALARRTWGVAQSVAELMLHLEAWRGYYHYVRPHTTLRERCLIGGQVRWQQRTPAMAAGLTSHRWSMVDLLSHPVIRRAPV